MPQRHASVDFSTTASCKRNMPEILLRDLLLDDSIFHPKKRMFFLSSFLSFLPL